MSKDSILGTYSINIIHGKILNGNVQLDMVCIHCEGKCQSVATRERCGPTSGYLEDGRCGRCEGRGYELTENGRAILDLVNRHKPTNVRSVKE